VLAALDHESLPRYVEHFEENGELWLVTKKIEGESLAERAGPRAAPFLDRAGAPVSRRRPRRARLSPGRSPPVIHRDIKPSNVIVRPDGSFALIDFGSVRDRLSRKAGATVVVTFGFMAPEQFRVRPWLRPTSTRSA